ncbi:hypothetical protein J6590_019872 [Homalodisca vitripennis]|nr:hypothetical protein J6590_019872 [Homalodisca vitripennis]
MIRLYMPMENRDMETSYGLLFHKRSTITFFDPKPTRELSELLPIELLHGARFAREWARMRGIAVNLLERISNE